jgi:hypothetical protein
MEKLRQADRVMKGYVDQGVAEIVHEVNLEDENRCAWCGTRH